MSRIYVIEAPGDNDSLHARALRAGIEAMGQVLNSRVNHAQVSDLGIHKTADRLEGVGVVTRIVVCDADQGRVTHRPGS